MSKIALSGSAAGSGTFTLAAPNSDSSYTLNLPQVSGGTLVSTDASGNVGLGVSPSAWGSGFRAIQLQNTGTNYIVGGSNNLQIGVNYYNNGSGNLYVNNSYATAYVQSAGQHQWYTAPSGTAGNGVGFTQVMTLDATGGLGIGKSTPTSTLDVGGSIQATHVTSSGYGMRIRSASSTSYAALQFTNSSESDDWGYLAAPSKNYMVWRTAQGSANPMSADASFSINGGSVCIDRKTGLNADIGDWPNPALGMRNYDSNFNGLTMLTMGGRDDNVMYQTASAIWAFRLWDTTNGWTTSSANTSMNLVGPGELYMYAGGTGGVVLTRGATSWASVSDESMKDIIEPITNAANKVASLRAVIGKYKTDEDGTRRSFLIAQDVQKVLPEAVGTILTQPEVDENDIYANTKREEKLSISYTDVIPLLVAAIKEQQEQINELKAQVAALTKA